MSKNKEKKNNYESLFIVKKGDEEKISSLKNSIDEIADDSNIIIWKEMKPAYQIKDIETSEDALYFLANFSCKKESLKMIEELFKTTPEIRRHITVNLDRDGKKMRIDKIQTPKPRIRKRTNFSRERSEQSQNNDSNTNQNKSFFKDNSQ